MPPGYCRTRSNHPSSSRTRTPSCCRLSSALNRRRGRRRRYRSWPKPSRPPWRRAARPSPWPRRASSSRALPVNTTVLPATCAVGRNRDDIGLRLHLAQQRIEHVVIALIAEEIDQRARSPCRRCRRSRGTPHADRRHAAVSLPTRMNSSMVEKVFASSAAVVSPIWRMPSAKMKRSSSGSRRASMAANSLSSPS